MATPSEDGIVPIVRRLALVFALSVTIALPGGYFGLNYSNLIEHVETVAQVKAGAVNALATANPDLWMYQLQRMEELLRRYPISLAEDHATVRDATGNSVLTVGVIPDAPVLVRRFPVYDSGRVLGYVEIAHSYRAVAFGTLVAALLGLLLGVMVYAAVLVLPLRALRRVTAALDREAAALRESEERFRAVAQSAADAIVTYKAAGNIVGWNAAAEKIFGYTEAEVIGKPFTLLISERYQDGHLSSVNRVLAGGEQRFIGKSVELHGLTKAGNEFPIELSLSEWETSEGRFLTGIIRDISERKNHELRISRLNRTLSVLSGINSAIVRIRDRQKLFEEACRIAVEHGNFGMAWISAFDPVTLDVTPIAYAGTGARELAGTKTTARADVPLGQGIVGRAIRAKDLVFVNDLTAEPDVGSARRREAIRLGYRSSIALPLLVEGAVFGTLTLYAKEPDFFDEHELRLLRELAGDISFALEHIAKVERLEKLSRIRAVSSGINAAIVRIRDRQALFEEICRIASEAGKFEMVWIGTLDTALQEVRAAAWAGFSDEAARTVSWASISTARGTMGEAMQTRRPALRNDIEEGVGGGHLRLEALKKGCHSTVCLPLVVDDRVEALVALFAGGRGFFDEDELALLEELAADVSFALDHIAKQERLDYLAYYDVLTGLPNRSLFVDRTNQRMRARGSEQRMVALMLLDLERFQNVNETLGRHAGDDLLRQVAARLKGAIEETDVLAHIGGDHFAIATRRAEQGEDVIHILDQVLTSVLSQPLDVGGNPLRLAARTGVAVYPADGADAEGLLKNAEAALRNAKKTGHRYQFYAPEMNARVAEQLKLESDLRNALLQEQYILHYQPRFNLVSGGIVGLEALIRWNHPERGLVPPGEFVPVLEETGMIIEVGSWALKRAALDHAAWSAPGFKPPRIAVNVSPIQLRRKDFADYVKKALATVDQAPDRIDIEITESMLMEDIGGSIEKLKAVRSWGLQVALDDFGTGYSSLSYLARLPIDSLKIDRSFITQLPKGPEHMAIVSTVISLGWALNLKVVAEGVETEEQANLLRLLRCDEVQGYLFGRPMPPDQIEALLARL